MKKLCPTKYLKKESSWKNFTSSFLWNIWCVGTGIGIWPQYIEPNLIFQRNFILNLPHLPKDLEGLRLLHFSDLHIHDGVNEGFLIRLQKKILAKDPHLILFTGDFLTKSAFDPKNAKSLEKFFFPLTKRCKVFSVLGNHDYEGYASLNENGIWDLVENKNPPLIEGLLRLFHKKKPAGRTSAKVKELSAHPELLDLLKTCNVTVLQNEAKLVPFGNSALNIVGLGEHLLGKADPSKAFQKYQKAFPGIVLIHNPDGWKNLANYPGDLLLSGHTHRGQVNLPWFRDRFVSQENPEIKYGPFHFENKVGFVTAGIGGTIRFRFLAPPELVLINLKKGPLKFS